MTLLDVARRAGVSASTASRALNGIGEMTPATRQAVLEAAAELRYVPFPLARSLRTRHTMTIGFVVPDVGAGFYAASLRGAQHTLVDAGYHIMLMDSERDLEEEVAALRTLVAHRVDGLLLATTGIDRETFEREVGDRTPCVFFDGVLDDVGVGAVSPDNLGGIRILVEHLVEHGHRRIAFLSGAQTESSGRERLEAFRLVAGEAGLNAPDDYVRLCDWDTGSGRAATLELLALDESPTAVVAASEDLALGCLQACRERGVEIPRDLALVSFDDCYFAELLAPPLTALRAPAGETGRLAAELLLEALPNPGAPRREERVPLSLVARASCGCPMDQR
ncbi:MAG TPA: LacI family DNA-binding transcriptional regulator [Baekduia sp.]|nr:LacI family DNA-binding transcriptional regulator [Baekduia sp.]